MHTSIHARLRGVAMVAWPPCATSPYGGPALSYWYASPGLLLSVKASRRAGQRREIMTTTNANATDQNLDLAIALIALSSRHRTRCRRRSCRSSRHTRSATAGNPPSRGVRVCVVAGVRGFAEAERGPGCRPGPRPPCQVAAHRACTQFEAVQAHQHARMDGCQGIQGALNVPVSLRIAVQSSPAQMLLILPSLRR
jgi:hypothetical protein